MTTPTGGDAVARKLAFSAATQGAARILHIALNVADSLLLIHYFHPSSYGSYVFVFAVAGLIGITSDMGLTKLAARMTSLDPRSGGKVIGTVICSRIGLALIAIVGAELILLGAGVRSELRIAIAIAASLAIAQAFQTLFVVFQVRVEQQWEALVRVAMELIEFGLIVFLVVSHGTLYQIVAAPVVGAVVGVLITGIVLKWHYGFHLGAERQLLRPLSRQAMLVGPATLIGVCYLKLDALVIAAFRPARELGLYGSAFQPVEYLLLASAIVVDLLFPLLNRSFAEDPERFRMLYRRGTESLVALCIPVGVVMSFYAPHVVHAAFGGQYEAAAAPLRILSWALVFMVINTWHGFVLLAGGLPRYPLAYQSVGLGLNVIVDLVLIGRIGYLAVAWGTLSTSALIAVVSFVVAARKLPAGLDTFRVLKVLAANLLLAGAFELAVLGKVEWLLAACAGAVLYPLLLLACRVFAWEQARSAITHGLGIGLRDAALVQP
jgi:O-antigen/teichoic acid export membrane protein